VIKILTYQLLEYSNEIRQSLDDFHHSTKILFSYAWKYIRLKSLINKHILLDTEFVSVHDKSNVKYSYVSNSPKSFIDDFLEELTVFRSNAKLRELSSNFDAFKNHIKQCKAKNDVTDSVIDDLLEKVDTALNNYEIYLQTNHRMDAFVFSESIDDFYTTFYNAVAHYKRCCEMITPIDGQALDTTGIEELEIQLLDVEFTFEQFISRLKSISTIYQKFREVIYRDESCAELSIVKIESGSLLAKVNGDSKIFEVTKLFLTKCIELCFAKFTKEGHIIRNDQVISQILKLTEVSEKLKELGCNTDEEDEVIKTAFALAARETHRLASSAPRFKINGKEFSSGQSKQEFLEAKEAPLLTDGIVDAEKATATKE